MKRISTTKLVLLGIAVFILGLIARLPASFAISIAESRVAGLSVAGSDGTVWNGSANGIAIQGVSIDAIEWNLHILNVFLLEAAADVELRLGRDTLQGVVKAGLGNKLTLENLRGEIRLETLEQLQLMPKQLASGRVILDIAKLELQSMHPVAATGRGQLVGLESSLLPGVALGDYAGELQTGDEGITLSYRDANAPLELQGNATLSADGSYRTEGSVRPTGDTPQELQNGMKFLGKTDNNGRYTFRFNGHL